MPDKVPECLPEHMPEDLPDRMPDRMSEDMPDGMSDRMPEDMSDRMPEDMSDRMPEDMPDRMSEDMPDRVPEHIAEDMPGRMPEDMPDRMPEDMPDKMPEDMSDRMPEDLPVTKRIDVMVGITRSKVIMHACIHACNYHILHSSHPFIRIQFTSKNLQREVQICVTLFVHACSKSILGHANLLFVMYKIMSCARIVDSSKFFGFLRPNSCCKREAKKMPNERKWTQKLAKERRFKTCDLIMVLS